MARSQSESEKFTSCGKLIRKAGIVLYVHLYWFVYIFFRLLFLGPTTANASFERPSMQRFDNSFSTPNPLFIPGKKLY
jgi:hypothetical protein